jgi:hypothetical protein
LVLAVPSIPRGGDAGDDEDPHARPCDSDKECRATDQLCDLTRHTCMACLDATDCDGAADSTLFDLGSCSQPDDTTPAPPPAG